MFVGVSAMYAKNKSFELRRFDPEIEKPFRRLTAIRKNETEAIATNKNQQQRAIRDYGWPIVNDNYSGITCQTIAANSFKLKSGLISMVQ